MFSKLKAKLPVAALALATVFASSAQAGNLKDIATDIRKGGQNINSAFDHIEDVLMTQAQVLSDKNEADKLKSYTWYGKDVVHSAETADRAQSFSDQGFGAVAKDDEAPGGSRVAKGVSEVAARLYDRFNDAVITYSRSARTPGDIQELRSIANMDAEQLIIEEALKINNLSAISPEQNVNNPKSPVAVKRFLEPHELKDLELAGVFDAANDDKSATTVSSYDTEGTAVVVNTSPQLAALRNE